MESANRRQRKLGRTTVRLDENETYQEPQAYILPGALALDKVAPEGNEYPHSVMNVGAVFVF